MNSFVNKELVKLSEPSYREFSSKLIPNIDNVLGVRTPRLRKFAKELLRREDFDIDKFLSIYSVEYMEFTLLQGFVIGLRKSDLKVFLKDIDIFVSRIDNWAVCDGFCSSLKNTLNYKSEVFEFLKKYLNSSKEYELRFGVVMLLDYFITEEYIERTLDILVTRKSNDYYAQMSIAWALSMCFVKFFDITYEYVSKSELSEAIFSKTVRKVCESLKSTEEQREKLKLLYKQICG